MLVDHEIFRTIPEIVALYELEPTIQDIYVEGVSDQYFVSHFLEQQGLSLITVYEAGSVNIPYSEFKDLGWDDNNRSRIIYLARELERSCTRDLFHVVVCLIDADFDYLYNKVHAERLLLLTDYTAFELYAYQEEIVSKFLRVVLRRKDLDAAVTLAAIQPALEELFIIRAVCQEKDLGIELLPIEKSLSISRSGEVDFDRGVYITKLLNKGAKLPLREEVLNRAGELHRTLPAEPRRGIHGHDFFDVLRWYLASRIRPKGGFDDRLFRGGLVGCIEHRHLASTEMFLELLRRIT